MFVTAGMAGAEDLLAALFGNFQIVGDLIAVRVSAQKNAI
jgi:hypothetical protein